jgi:hypothetical protein
VSGGDLGQRLKIFRKKIYGSYSPPVVAVFGPSVLLLGVFSSRDFFGFGYYSIFVYIC